MSDKKELILYSLLVLFLVGNTGSALECFKCTSMNITTDYKLSKFVKNTLTQLVPGCLHPNYNTHQVAPCDGKTSGKEQVCMETCPSGTEWRCAAIIGSLMAKQSPNISIDLGKYDASFSVRGCINASEVTNTPPDFQCVMSRTQSVDNLMAQLPIESGFFDISMYINWACYCNEDGCTPEHCNPGDLQIVEACLNGPLFGVSQGCIVIILGAIMFCFCRGECCECCYPCSCYDHCIRVRRSPKYNQQRSSGLSGAGDGYRPPGNRWELYGTGENEIPCAPPPGDSSVHEDCSFQDLDNHDFPFEESRDTVRLYRDERGRNYMV